MGLRHSDTRYELTVLPGLNHADAAQVGAMLRLETAKAVWDDADLAVLWRQQLISRIVGDLAPLDARLLALIDTLSTSVTPTITSFGQLLKHPAVPAKLLEVVRQLVKKRIANPEYMELQQINKVLYYAMIATAVCGRHPRPTGLTPPELHTALTWTCSRPWLDNITRQLCHAALELLASGNSAPKEPPP